MHMLHVCDDVIMMNDMMVLVKRMYAYCNVTHPTVRGAERKIEWTRERNRTKDRMKGHIKETVVIVIKSRRNISAVLCLFSASTHWKYKCISNPIEILFGFKHKKYLILSIAWRLWQRREKERKKCVK